MTADKPVVIGWVFAAIVVSGLSTIFAGKWLQVSLALIHKLLAVLCLVLLLCIGSGLRAFDTQPALRGATIIFAVAYLAAFASGVVQSIPAFASSLWLNLHRVAAVIATIACVAASRLIANGALRP